MSARTLLLAIVTLAAAACGPSAAQISAVTSLTGDATNGRTVYEAQCKTCHGSDGISGTEKKPIVSEAKNNLDGTVSLLLSGEDEMPSFDGVLTNQEMADVIAYVRTL